MAFHTSPYPSSQPLIQYGRGKSAYKKGLTTKSSSWLDFTHLFLPEALTFPQKKEASPWILPWTMEEGTPKERGKDNVTNATLLTLDVDNKAPPYITFEQAQQALHRAIQDPQSPLYNHAAILYTTWSHTPDHPHFRVFLPLDPANLIHKDQTEKLNALGRSIMVLLSIPEHTIDSSAFHAARLFFLPAGPDTSYQYQHAIFPTDPQTATFLNPDNFLASSPAPTKPKANNVMPINPTIQLPVHKASTPAPSTLPATIDQKQYKNLMVVSAKCLKEQGEPQWTLHTLADMQDAAPRMGLEDRTNYAILINCLATYETEIDNLPSPLPGRAFDTFKVMARQAKGYESMPEKEYRAHWEDVKSGGNEYGFKGFEAIHPGVLFRKALDNGWSKTLVKPNAKSNYDTLENREEHRNAAYWPYKFKHGYTGPLTHSGFELWVANEIEGRGFFAATGDDAWFYDKDESVYVKASGSNLIRGIGHAMAHWLRGQGEKEKDLVFLTGSALPRASKDIAASLRDVKGSKIIKTKDQIGDFNCIHKHILPVANGYLNLKTKQFLDLSDQEKADMMFVSKVPFPYIENAGEPEMFLDFLYDVCMEREDMVEDMRDFLASTLWGEKPSMGIFYGPSSRGKSTLTSTMLLLFDGLNGALNGGVESFGGFVDSSIIQGTRDGVAKKSSAPSPELFTLLNRRFIRMQEVSASGVPFDEEVLKKLYGSEKSIKFRALYVNDELTLNPTATFIIETNHYITFVGEPDRAVERRIAVFPFEYEVPEGKRMKDMHVKFIEQEAEKILWWLVNAKHPMKTDREWGPTVMDATDKMLNDASLLRRFFNFHVERTGDFEDRISLPNLYHVYSNWVLSEGLLNRFDKQEFEKRIKSYVPTGSYIKEVVNHTEVRYFQGVKFADWVPTDTFPQPVAGSNRISLVQQFLLDECVVNSTDSGAFISSSDIFNMFRMWCVNNKIRVGVELSQKAFGSLIERAVGIGPDPKPRRVKGSSPQRGFTGIRRKEDGE